MTDRELMQQALNLLDDINQCSLPPTGIPLPAEIDHVMETLRARLAQPEQEPVAWLDDEGYSWVPGELPDDYRKLCKPLYTAPPQREWQGLTDEEVKDIVWNLPYEPSQEHIRAIEAKLKEKNT